MISEQDVIKQVPKKLFIDGQWTTSTSNTTFEVQDPATGKSLCEVADGNDQDALLALDACERAQKSWSKYPPRQRGEILRHGYEQIIERSDYLATLMTLEMGKPFQESKAEIVYAAEFFRWFSEEAVRIDGRFAVAPNGNGRLLTMRQPVGPSLLITPWNFPLAMATRKMGPAIAAGCTMVVKPASLTPLCTLAVTQILQEVGLPEGVLNVITTSSSSKTTKVLFDDPRLRKMSFTGSTEVGRTLMSAASKNVLKISMELGGNAPFLVFEDADLDAAVEGAVIAKMRNIGQACTAANRFHVASSIAKEFSEKLAQRLETMKVGRGLEDGVEVGPLINQDAIDKTKSLVEDAIGKGGQVLTGAKQLDRGGYFYQPTVISNVARDAKVLQEEIFAPVAPIVSFDSEQQAIEMANDTPFGLVAYVFTKDLERSFRVAEELQVGMLGLNQGMVSNPAAPFGGVKLSGIGREGGYEGIDEYLETKYIAMKI